MPEGSAPGEADRDAETEEVRQEPFTIVDSAGVVIATSFAPAWEEGEGWIVEPEPFLQIGSLDGSVPGTDLTRVGPVVRFRDGRVAVADLAAHEIRIFDAEGRWLDTWGGPGDGPGEFGRFERIQLLGGDSLAVIQSVGRIDILAPDGSFGRRISFTMLGVRMSELPVLGSLDDGSLLIGPANVGQVRGGPGRELLQGDWMRLGVERGESEAVVRLPDRWVVMDEATRTFFPLLYSGRAVQAGGPEGVWWGFPDRFELRHLDEGGVRRVIRRAWEPDTLPDEARERFLEWIEPRAGLEGIDAGMRMEITQLARAEFEQTARDPESTPLLDFAEALPAFIGLEVAEDGHLWVRLPQTLEELRSGHPAQLWTDRWSVFDPEGRWLGTVETPSDLEVRAFGGDWVAGIWRDELDVDYVRFHRLSLSR